MVADVPANDAEPAFIHGRAARWIFAPLLMLGAAYACWVIAREVLWVAQEREPLTVLTTLALVYMAVAVWTSVWVAVTIWTAHTERQLFWLWAALLPLPGLAMLGVGLLTVVEWGGPLDADFGQGVALVGALIVLEVVGLLGLRPRFAVTIGRRLKALRRRGARREAEA